MKREYILLTIVILCQPSSFKMKLTNFILNKVKEKRKSEGQGRMLKLTNTKKLATHNNMLQITIRGCLSWETEEEQAGPEEAGAQQPRAIWSQQ